LHSKKHLSFPALRKTISKRLEQIDDPRRGKVTYALHDCFMSAFAMMFLQDPSLLQFQLRLQDGLQRNNLTNLFHVGTIPKDSQLRDLLDVADNDPLYKLFADSLNILQRSRYLDLFRFLDTGYLLAIDGSQYFGSEKLHCPKCLAKTSTKYSLMVKGKRTYHNSWITNMPVTDNNVTKLVKAGRARWKIENECFNTLKNQGYHIEHNFGHGNNNLSMTFFLLNLLAFLVHQILQLTDRLYQKCRKGFSSRIEFWNQLRCTLRVMTFNDFDHLLNKIIDPLNVRPP